MTHPWSEIKARPYRYWYQFGLRSPSVLWRRLHLHPINRSRFMWQRARRGWSEEDVWNFHSHLAHVIADGVAHMREISHGHPVETTPKEWDEILRQIEEGFRAAIFADETGAFEEEGGAFMFEDSGKEKFERGFALMEKWWFGLWD